MPGPCPFALSMSRVPRQRWATRAELLERVELARQMILQSPGQDLKVSGLARLAGISESHFIRLFGHTYGVSPRQMLCRRRMEVACQLLLRGKDVSEVALAVGYSSLPTFCRRFKEAFGSTPGEYAMKIKLVALTEPQSPGIEVS